MTPTVSGCRLRTEVPDVDRAEVNTLERPESCPLCGNREFTLVFHARDTLHQMDGDWGVVRCTDCGLMHTSPRPNRETISRYYPPDYQPFSAPLEPTTLTWWKKMLKPVSRRLLDPKEQVLPKGTPPGKALEVGCGSGRLLAELAALGWDVVGLEPSQATVDGIRAQTDLEVIHGAIDSAEFGNESFDLVAAIMVLEHLRDPLGDLEKLRRWLRPGGHLMGSVPNCASWEFRYFGPEWYALQVPTHLFHYTPDTLTAMLERAGFHRITIYHQRNVNNLMVHLGRWLARRGSRLARVCLEYPEKSSLPLRLALRPMATLFAWLRQAGRITFLAENPVDTR